jgi:hypothetical protein
VLMMPVVKNGAHHRVSTLTPRCVPQVKMKFENNKDVYDQFLDIMKDFQSRL